MDTVKVFIAMRPPIARGIFSGLHQDWIRWSSAKRKSLAKQKKLTKRLEPQAQRENTCIACSSAHFEWPSKFGTTPRLHAVPSPSARSRADLRRKTFRSGEHTS